MNLRRRQEQGSTILVVAALLSVLLIMVALLSVRVRMDSLASENYAQATQARAAVVGALPRAMALVREATTVTSLLQRWNTVGNARPDYANARTPRDVEKNHDLAASLKFRFASELAEFSIVDLSSRVNLNAVRSERALVRFFSAIFSNATTGFSAEARARAVAKMLDLREDDETTRELDLRLPPTTGKPRIESLGMLLADPVKAPDLFRHEELLALARYATCFSVSPEVFTAPDGSTWPKTPLAGLTADRAYQALKRAFPKKDDRLLRQYAVNLVDFLDTDETPTVLPDPAHPEPWNALIGVEETPFITEVYPDAATSVGGDEGQFVEIFNPWNHPLTMHNWRLLVGGASGGAIVLNATLPPKGSLVVTDNYESPRSDAPVGTGCFLGIFGARREEPQRQLLEVPSFHLPDKNSFVTLVNDQGKLIDVFSYTDTAPANSLQSYQRADPTVRAFYVGLATPFDVPAAGDSGWHTLARLEQSRRELSRAARKNRGVAWLLCIPTSYAGLRGGGGAQRSTFAPHLWQLPARHVSGRTGGELTTNLDARVLDVFTAGTITDSLLNRAGGPWWESRIQQQMPSPTQHDTAYVFGRINLNTCARPALYAIDAEANGVDLLSSGLIEKIERYRVQQYSSGQPPFTNLSDFVSVFFADLTNDEIPALDKLLAQVTVNSAGFEIVAETRTSPAGEGSSSLRAPAICRAKWTVALDFTRQTLLDFRVKP